MLSKIKTPIQDERNREKRAEMLIHDHLISDDGLALIKRDPNLTENTLAMLQETEVSVCAGTKSPRWYFDTDGQDKNGSGLAVLSMIIKEDLNQTLSDIVEKYALLRKTPYIYSAQAISDLRKREGCLYFFTIEEKSLCRHKWQPRRVKIPNWDNTSDYVSEAHEPTEAEIAWLNIAFGKTTSAVQINTNPPIVMEV